MSYPRKVHTLVVEDERAVREGDRIFHELSADYDLAPPVYATSHADAQAELRLSCLIQLLILDLNLPMEVRAEALPGLEPGLRLLEMAAARDHYPIPAALVISGRLGQAKLPELHDRLERGFWYGEFVNKGVDDIDEIAKAIRAIHRYSDVGIHIHDAPGRLCPTLAPREEDLLRRCILGREGCIGVDLDWWGAYRSGTSSPGRAGAALAKVLGGHFMLDNGLGGSRTSFFKFEAGDDAVVPHRDAATMNDKLSHVKVACTLRSSGRALLVTQKVGESPNPPISLADFLRGEPVRVMPQIPRIVQDVADQLDALGTSHDDQRRVAELLWQHHEADRLSQAWAAYADEQLAGDETADPRRLFDELRGSRKLVWVRLRSCNHGDLNATNVAVDAMVGGARAYIFDASGMRADLNVRDLAMLEVTSLLHQSGAAARDLLQYYADFYDAAVEPPAQIDVQAAPAPAQNGRLLVAEIRRRALTIADPPAYALAVLDAVLIQLGGLTYDLVRNKNDVPGNVARLAGWTCRWYRRVAGLAAS